MNQNGRRIALSLVAIVLGAGFLMRVIPRETDVGTDEAHTLQIDGSLVTNPLDITELSPNLSPAGLPNYSLSANPGHPLDLLKEPGSEVSNAAPGRVTSPGSTEVPSLDSTHGDTPQDNESPLSGPSTPGHLPSPVSNENGGNGSNPGSNGGGGGGAGGSGPGSTVPPIIGGGPLPGQTPPSGSDPLPPPLGPVNPDEPGTELPPSIDLPTDPRDVDPKGGNPIDDGAGSLPPSEIVIPLDPPSEETPPLHSVPETGSTVGLLSLVFVAMAAGYRRLRPAQVIQG